jgi:hypothetical protein
MKEISPSVKFEGNHSKFAVELSCVSSEEDFLIKFETSRELWRSSHFGRGLFTNDGVSKGEKRVSWFKSRFVATEGAGGFPKLPKVSYELLCEQLLGVN